MVRRTKRKIFFNTWRALFKIVVFIIIIVAYLTSTFLETNVDDYDDTPSKDFAIHAIKLTSDTFKNTLDQLLIVSYAIESMDEEDGEPTSSVITAYTVFGIPYAEVIAYKDGAYVNKKFLFNK